MSARTATALLLAASLGCGSEPAPTAQATSPDGKWRILLVEIEGFLMIDRNFNVFLEDRGPLPGKRRQIFHSPDEGRPIGTERFIWSKDSRHVLLIGKNFGVVSPSISVGPGLLYLLVDLEPETLRCNAAQQDRLRNFTLGDVAGIPWADAAFQSALDIELRNRKPHAGK